MSVESVFGMTAFTQYALEELRKIQLEKRKERKAAELRRQISLAPLDSPSKNRTPMKQAQLTAARLQEAMAARTIAASSPEHSPTKSQSPKKIMSSSQTTETFHHRHLVEKRRDTIVRLEMERLAAIEEAKEEAQRQEATRQRRLDRQYHYRIANLQRVADQLEGEKETLDAEHEALRAAGLIRPPLPRSSFPERHKLAFLPGQRVRLLPLHIVRSAYASYDLPLPNFPENCSIGTVVSDVNRLAVWVNFGSEKIELLKSCIQKCDRAEVPSAPLVITPKGQALQLSSQQVVVEVIGDLAIVTHTTDWNFEVPFDTNDVDLNAFVNDDGEFVAMIFPNSAQATLISFKSTICGTKLRSAVLSRKDAAAMVTTFSQARREREETPQATPRALSPRHGSPGLSPRKSPRPGFHHARTPTRSPRNRPRTPEIDMLHETLSFGALTFGEFDAIWGVEAPGRVWRDCFGVSKGPSSQKFTTLPLQPACRLRPIQSEVTYIVAARSFIVGGEPRFLFSLPCTIPEHCLMPRVMYDNISTFDVIVEGFSHKSIHLESCPESKPRRGTTFGNHTAAAFTKIGRWNNGDVEVSWVPERGEEVAVNAFAETNPSSCHTDTFLIIITPPIPQPGDTQFRHTVEIVVDVTTPEMFHDVLFGVRHFVEQLQATDLVQICFAPSPLGTFLRYQEGKDPFAVSEVGEKEIVLQELDAFCRSVEQMLPVAAEGEGTIAELETVLSRCAAALAPGLLQRQRSVFRKVADNFREVLLFTDRTLCREAQRSIALMQKHHGNAHIRFSTCVLCPNSATSIFWQAITARSRGNFCRAHFRDECVLDIESFVNKVTRPILVDIDVSFLHTSDLQCYGGIRDLRADNSLVICGRYNYAAPAESLNESVGISGRLAKGRALRKRVLCAKIGLPLSRLLQHRQLMHTTALAWADELVAPGQYNAEEIINEACHFNIPIEVPVEFVNEAKSERRPSSTRCKTPSLSLVSRTACVSLCVYQSVAEGREVHNYPPFLTGPSPGLVAPGNASSWGHYNETKVKKDALDCGCFAPVTPYSCMELESEQDEGLDFRNRLVGWLQSLLLNYADSVNNLVTESTETRMAIEEEEWSLFLSILQVFHAKRMWITQQDVCVSIKVTEIEETTRIEREAIQNEQLTAWDTFLHETQNLRGVMRRVNVFAEEHRKRLSYAEEDARKIIVSQQSQLWLLGTKVLSAKSVTIADVEYLVATIDQFNGDSEMLEFISCMLTVWTLTESKAEVIGLHGGIRKVKSLMQQHSLNQMIVSFSLATLYNFAKVRTTHGRLESCSIVIDVMDIFVKHFSSRRVIFAGVRCLTILGQLSQNFRRMIISSPNGLMFAMDNYSRFSADRSFCILIFDFLNVVAMDPTSHRTIVELAMRTMASSIIMQHRSCDTLLLLFFRMTGQLASSRALRMLLAVQGMPTAAIVAALSNPESCSLRTLREALHCAEKMCGNLNDYPAIVMSLSLHTVLTNFLSDAEIRQDLNSLLEITQRLLSRLSVCHGKISVDSDEIIKPLHKPWSALRIDGVVGPNSLRSLYGAVCSAFLDLAGFASNVLIRVFSYHELCEYLPAQSPTSTDDQTTLLMELYSATLSLQLQDVLVNAFIAHPRQLKCLGFSLQDGIHATIYERTPGPSLEFLLQQSCAPKELYKIGFFAEMAFTLFDVAAYFADCNAAHGMLILANIFVSNDEEIVVGPASHLTPDIVASLPSEQRLFDRDALFEIATRGPADDVLDVVHALALFLSQGTVLEDPTSVCTLLPEGLVEALDWPRLLECSTPSDVGLSSATVRERIGEWHASVEASMTMQDAIPLPSADP